MAKYRLITLPYFVTPEAVDSGVPPLIELRYPSIIVGGRNIDTGMVFNFLSFSNGGRNVTIPHLFSSYAMFDSVDCSYYEVSGFVQPAKGMFTAGDLDVWNCEFYVLQRISNS